MGSDRFQIGEFWLDQHANGTFYATWLDRGARQTRRRSLRTRDPEQARERLAEFAVANKRMHRERAEDVTVVELLGRYAESHLPRTAAAETNRHHLRAAAERIGALTVAEFGLAAQEDLVDEMRDDGAAGSTIKRRLTAVRAALNWAFKRELIERVPPFVTVDVGEQRSRDLTLEELRALWAAPMPDHTRTFLALAMGTMGRKSVVLRLTRFQVDLDRGLVDLHPPGARRTKKRNPVVPLVPFLRPYVEAAEGHLVQYKGKPVDDIKHSFEAAGLTDVVPKDIRTTMSTLLRGMGIPETHIEGGLGHTAFSAGTTARYAKYRPEYLREWADAVESVCREVTGRGAMLGGFPSARLIPHTVRATCVQKQAEPRRDWSE